MCWQCAYLCCCLTNIVDLLRLVHESHLICQEASEHSRPKGVPQWLLLSNIDRLPPICAAVGDRDESEKHLKNVVC